MAFGLFRMLSNVTIAEIWNLSADLTKRPLPSIIEDSPAIFLYISFYYVRRGTCL